MLNMFYSVTFLLCFFTCSSTTLSTKHKVFFISGYNTSNAISINKTTIKYRYEKNEVLNLSCHNKQKKPVIWLRWWHSDFYVTTATPSSDEQNIPGLEDQSNENKLIFNITRSNDKDRLTCYAFEDDTGLMKNEKKYEKTAILILDYIGHEDTTEINVLMESVRETADTENWFEKLSKSTLFWIGLVVAIVVIILATILIFAHKRSYRIKDEKLGLHSAVSQASVFSSDSRTPIIPIKLEANFYTNDAYCTLHASREIINSEYQEPIDSQAYCEPQTYSEPDKQLYAEPIRRILRMKKDNLYVNYNETNGSANINNANIDLYQNCDHNCNDEFDYYTETC